MLENVAVTLKRAPIERRSKLSVYASQMFMSLYVKKRLHQYIHNRIQL